MSTESWFREPTLQRFLRLLVWVRERPEDYCKTVEELNEFLGQLYDLCAVADGQGAHFEWVLDYLLAERGLLKSAELLTESEKQALADKSNKAAEKVIAFWTQLDSWLSFPSPAF